LPVALVFSSQLLLTERSSATDVGGGVNVVGKWRFENPAGYYSR